MKLLTRLLNKIPTPLRYTLVLQGFGFFKIPLIFFVRPKVILLDEQQCVIRVKFRRNVKNHLNSMYFGALAIAAECTGGAAVIREIQNSGQKISLVFKSFHADFFKRVDSDAVFTCSNVPELKALVARAAESGQREEEPFDVVATCPDKYGDEILAQFRLVVSLKRIN